MKAITVSNFRAKLKQHLDEVSENSEVIIIPRNNKEDDAIVVMSIGEYNAMKANTDRLGSGSKRKENQNSLSGGNTKLTKNINRILSEDNELLERLAK